MKISVAVCTWNRAHLLDMTLTAMRRLRIPTGTGWEILVINNNCTDNTEEVVRSHAGALPVRAVFEPSPGLSHARNRAVTSASGDYLLWTDDDVLVDTDWVAAYVAAIERSPDTAIFGGPIAPLFEGTPPRWLKSSWRKVANAYAVCDLGPRPVPLTSDSLPYGANYAVRLSAQKRYPYDPALGRKGGNMMGYEEVMVMRAMFRDGLTGIWVPGAKVSHFIPRARQEVSYLKRYFHGEGLYLAGSGAKSDFPTLFGYPRWLVRRTIQDRLVYQVNRLFRTSDVWIDDLKEASKSWGMLQGCGRRGRAA